MSTVTETRMASLSKNIASNVQASLARAAEQQAARLKERAKVELQRQRSLDSRSRLATKGLDRLLAFAQNPQLQEILKSQMEASPGSTGLLFHELPWCQIGTDATHFFYIMFHVDGVVLSTRNTCWVTNVCHWKFFFEGKLTRSAGLEHDNLSPDQAEEIDRPRFFREVACTEKVDLVDLIVVPYTMSPSEETVVFQTLVNLAHEKAFNTMVEEFLARLDWQFRSH